MHERYRSGLTRLERTATASYADKDAGCDYCSCRTKSEYFSYFDAGCQARAFGDIVCMTVSSHSDGPRPVQINNNNYSIIEIIQMLERRDLVVNSDYQRGSGIWPPGPSSYFIDTILENFPFPKIYMYEFLDRHERSVKREIVDGQQRISAIRRFYNGEISLGSDSAFAGMRFADLPEEKQNDFLSYSVSVDVIRNAQRSEILQMFRRMNAYTLPLNEAEKRHSSHQGLFKWFINEKADEFNEFFLQYGVLTGRQIIRMSDAALIADCILSIEQGVISTSPKALDNLYSSYDEHFPNEGYYGSVITEAFRYIIEEFGDLRGSFMMKPYALHSLITALIHSKYGIEKVREEWAVGEIGVFATNPGHAAAALLELAQAHEAKEIDGPHGKYVWGCLSTTDRKARRTARVAAIMRILGVPVPVNVDADLS